MQFDHIGIITTEKNDDEIYVRGHQGLGHRFPEASVPHRMAAVRARQPGDGAGAGHAARGLPRRQHPRGRPGAEGPAGAVRCGHRRRRLLPNADGGVVEFMEYPEPECGTRIDDSQVDQHVKRRSDA